VLIQLASKLKLMNSLHARYPFFEAARDAVRDADVDLSELIAAEDPAVERAHERVRRSLLEGTARSETPDAWTETQELLSYPIARILVSLLNSAPAIEKYAQAEAKTAIDRLQTDIEADDDELRSTSTVRLDRKRLLRELGLSAVIVPEPTTGPREPAWFRIDVGPYLELSSSTWREKWKLVNRELVDGQVRVERHELQKLLQKAVTNQVQAGLPFEGLENNPISDALEAELADLNRLLSQRSTVGAIDFVARELFPPCIENLLQKAENETQLIPVESFTLMAFLTGIGMDADEIVAFCDASSLDPEGIRYQIEYLKDDRGTQYPPPSCETLNTYGICHNEDEHWKQAGDPLTYYKKQVEQRRDDVTDWRETRS